MTVLVTGGAGFIGGYTCVEPLNVGYEIVVVDNLINFSKEVLDHVMEIMGEKLYFYELDLLDRKKLDQVFEKEEIQAVIHFAGLRAVGESVYKPLEYYHNNIAGTLAFCECMRKHDVKSIVFPSSATVYGNPAFIPITEEYPKGEVTNPYGRTKAMPEQVLADLRTADVDWNVMLFRCLNPIGAHESGRMGEDPKGVPNNLFPYITQVAIGKLICLGVSGNDYETKDGTCIRDYIHVMNLTKGHVKALEKMARETPEVRIYNLGTGTGYLTLDVITALEKANDLKINYVFKERHAGDVPVCYADPPKVERELGRKVEKTLEEMCRDSWKRQKNNPNGYEDMGLTIRKRGELR